MQRGGMIRTEERQVVTETKKNKGGVTMELTMKETEWKGKKVFGLYRKNKKGEERMYVGFGVEKAKAILQHLDEVKLFAERPDASK